MTINTFTQNEINAAVSGIFGMAIENKLSAIVPSAYVFGLFAQEDIRILASALNSVRRELISMQFVQDKPLQDRPAEGSLDANDTGKPDEHADERAVAIKDAAYEAAIIERRIRSLELQAKEETEEAGKTTADGGRIRFTRRSVQFRSYVPSWDDFIVEMKEQAEPNSMWLAKIEQAQETVDIPYVSAQDAIDNVHGSFDEDGTLKRAGERAWNRIVELSIEWHELSTKHEGVMSSFNAMEREDQQRLMGAIAAENKEYKAQMRKLTFKVEKALEAVNLLAITGIPTWLVESPYWMTAEAEKATKHALGQLAIAKAKIQQVDAQTALLDADEALAAANALLKAKSNALLQRVLPPAEVAPTEAAPAPTEASAPVAPTATVGKPRNIGGGAAGFAPAFRRH